MSPPRSSSLAARRARPTSARVDFPLVVRCLQGVPFVSAAGFDTDDLVGSLVPVTDHSAKR